MLAMPQMRPAKTVPVADSPDLVEVTYEGSPSPRELLENIVIQAQAALKGLQQGVTKVNVFEGLTEEEMNRLTKEQLEKIQKEQKRKSDDEGNDVLGAFWCVSIRTWLIIAKRSLHLPVPSTGRWSRPRVRPLSSACEHHCRACRMQRMADLRRRSGRACRVRARRRL